MEKDILHTLNFMITVPSSFRFLQRYRRLSGLLNNEEVFYYAWYILEICLLDASLLRFKPSQLAAAALILSSRQLCNKNGWNKEVEGWSGYSEAIHLKEAIQEVKTFAMEINPKFIQVLKYKFGKSDCLHVSKHTFKF